MQRPRRVTWGQAIAHVQDLYPDRRLACSVWTALVIRHQRGLDDDPDYSGGPDGEEQSLWWQQMQNQPHLGPDYMWACIDALIAVGGVEVAPDALIAGTLCCAQFWRGDFRAGHQALFKVWPYWGHGVGQTMWESQESTGFVDRQVTIEGRRVELQRTYGGEWVVRVVAL